MKLNSCDLKLFYFESSFKLSTKPKKWKFDGIKYRNQEKLLNITI